MINISKVYKRDDKWAFILSSPDLSKGYEFNSEKGAKRGRAMLLKKIKGEGHKITC